MPTKPWLGILMPALSSVIGACLSTKAFVTLSTIDRIDTANGRKLRSVPVPTCQLNIFLIQKIIKEAYVQAKNQSRETLTVSSGMDSLVRMELMFKLFPKGVKGRVFSHTVHRSHVDNYTFIART